MKGYIFINEEGEYAQEVGPSGFGTKNRIIFGSLHCATVFAHKRQHAEALAGLNAIPAKVVRIVTIIPETELNKE